MPNIYDENHEPDSNRKDQVLFLGECMGVRLVPRGNSDNHIMFQLMVEDDDNWFVKGTISSGWIDELIKKLKEARDFMKTQNPDMHEGRQYGWNFRRRK